MDPLFAAFISPSQIESELDEELPMLSQSFYEFQESEYRDALAADLDIDCAEDHDLFATIGAFLDATNGDMDAAATAVIATQVTVQELMRRLNYHA
jgi:hypothetical protein